MSWAVGFDSRWNRDIGYGVPAICDHPECKKEIDRGLSYVCGNDMYGGEHGCGLHFCEKHRSNYVYLDEEGNDSIPVCERCADPDGSWFEAKPDTKEWIDWKLTDESWGPWREENPEKVADMRQKLAEGYYLEEGDC